MKTIELTDEQYNFLVEAQEALKTQDVRCTANPIYYNKYTDYLPTSSDFEDGHYIRNPDFTESWDDDESFIDYIADCHPEFWDALEEIYKADSENTDTLKQNFLDMVGVDCWDGGTDFTEWFVDSTSDDDTIREDLLDKFEDELEGYDYVPTMRVEKNLDSGCFSLFEKDLEFHKMQNQHNFRKNTYSYVGSIQRTPMMLELMKLLKDVRI